MGSWVEGPRLVGDPSLGWRMVSVEHRERTPTVSRRKAQLTPESLGLPSGAAVP